MPAEFIKWHGNSIESDAGRLRALEYVCNRVDGTTTAPVQCIFTQDQKIAYTRMELNTSLGDMIDHLDIFTRVGSLLARMHEVDFPVEEKHFTLAPYPLEQLGIDALDSEVLTEAFPGGWFHSDFWYNNIFVLENGEIAVIDPIPASFFMRNGHITACGAADAAMMYMSIFVRRPIMKQFTLDIRRHLDASEAFLHGYMKQRNVYSCRVVASMRRAALALAREWISRSSVRLTWPVFALKREATMRVISSVEKILGST